MISVVLLLKDELAGVRWLGRTEASIEEGRLELAGVERRIWREVDRLADLTDGRVAWVVHIDGDDLLAELLRLGAEVHTQESAYACAGAGLFRWPTEAGQPKPLPLISGGGAPEALEEPAGGAPVVCKRIADGKVEKLTLAEVVIDAEAAVEVAEGIAGKGEIIP